jgi:biopolymer transport protein ExbB/TolQ
VTIAATIVGPVIVLSVLAAALFGLALWLTRAFVQVTVAERAAAAAARRNADATYKAMCEQLARYADATDRVIIELESHPATYGTFPADVRDAVYAAHDSARELERKGK